MNINSILVNWFQVWPPESFEEGAEFLDSLSKSFDQAHGVRLKTVFAETLVHVLHPIGKVSFFSRSFFLTLMPISWRVVSAGRDKRSCLAQSYRAYLSQSERDGI